MKDVRMARPALPPSVEHAIKILDEKAWLRGLQSYQRRGIGLPHHLGFRLLQRLGQPDVTVDQAVRWFQSALDAGLDPLITSDALDHRELSIPWETPLLGYAITLGKRRCPQHLRATSRSLVAMLLQAGATPWTFRCTLHGNIVSPWLIAAQQRRDDVLTLFADAPEPSDGHPKGFFQLPTLIFEHDMTDWVDPSTRGDWYNAGQRTMDVLLKRFPDLLAWRWEGGTPLMNWCRQHDLEGLAWAVEHRHRPDLSWQDTWTSPRPLPHPPGHDVPISLPTDRPFSPWPALLQRALAHGIDDPVVRYLGNHSHVLSCVAVPLHGYDDRALAMGTFTPMAYALHCLNHWFDHPEHIVEVLRFVAERLSHADARLPTDAQGLTPGERWAADRRRNLLQLGTFFPAWLSPNPTTGRNAWFEVVDAETAQALVALSVPWDIVDRTCAASPAVQGGEG